MEQEKSSGRLGQLTDKVIKLFSHRLVVSGLVLYQGIVFLIDPLKAPDKLASSIGITVLIAAGGILIGAIASKPFSRQSLLTAAEATAFCILGTAMVIFSGTFGLVLREAVSLMLLFVGGRNLYGLIRHRQTENRLFKRHKPKNKAAVEVAQAVKDDFKNYNGRLISQLKKQINTAGAFFVGQLMTNIAIIVFGVLMLTANIRLNKVWFRIMGIFMAVSAVNDLLLFLRETALRRRSKSQADEPEQ